MPLEITFAGGLTASDALRRRVKAEAQKLEKFQDRIVGCRVALTGRSGRRKHGDLFAVRLQISVPGGRDIVVDRNPDADHAHEDPYVTIRDAFNAARRRLQDRHRRMRGQAKVHAEPSLGRIRKVHKDGYGFIETPDGREIYFHRNALQNTQFASLKPGAQVRFVEAEGDDLVQASTVHVVRAG
jgi:cold shock CspA family protein/ribosome-associated translation inhibitor RaiA